MSNSSIPSYDDCVQVSDICPVESTPTQAILSLGGSIFFCSAFAICFLFQMFFGFKGRTWGFLLWVGIGVAFEVIGFLCRAGLSYHPWATSFYLTQYMALLVAPTFIAAAISITFKYIVLWFGSQWSLLRPSLYPWVFVGTDFITIIVQFAGVAMLALSVSGNGNPALGKLSNAMVVGGVVFQVVNLVICMLFMLVYFKRRQASIREGVQHLGSGDVHERHILHSRSTMPNDQTRARMFVYAAAVAYSVVIIRCSYRLLESFPSLAIELRSNEPLFLVMDSTMILLSVGLMTTFHPSLYFPYMTAQYKGKPLMQEEDEFRLQELYLSDAGPEVWSRPASSHSKQAR